MSGDRLGQTAIVFAILAILAAIVGIAAIIAEGGGWNLIWVPINLAVIAASAWMINDIRGKRRRNRRA